MYKSKRKFICVLMAAILLFISGSVSLDRNVSAETQISLPYQKGTDEDTENEYLIDYVEITANKKFSMYADMSK